MTTDVDRSDFPTPAEAPGVIEALYEELRERAARPRTEEHTLFRPSIPVVTDSPDAADWLAKVAAVWDCGGR